MSLGAYFGAEIKKKKKNFLRHQILVLSSTNWGHIHNQEVTCMVKYEYENFVELHISFLICSVV